MFIIFTIKYASFAGPETEKQNLTSWFLHKFYKNLITKWAMIVWHWHYEWIDYDCVCVETATNIRPESALSGGWPLTDSHKSHSFNTRYTYLVGWFVYSSS